MIEPEFRSRIAAAKDAKRELRDSADGKLSLREIRQQHANDAGRALTDVTRLKLGVLELLLDRNFRPQGQTALGED